MQGFEDIVNEVKKITFKIKLICAQPYDDSTLEALAIVRAWNDNIEFTLLGESKKIAAHRQYDSLKVVEIIETETEMESLARAVVLVEKERPAVLMKGLVNTADFLSTLFKSESVKSAGKLISHVSCLEIPKFDRLLFITDGTVNVSPNLREKIAIVNNVCNFVRSLGFKKPKVAVIGVNEKISPANADLIDGAVISKMAERGQFGECHIDGPMPLDTAIKKEAALKKNILSPVGGQADVLVCSNLESAANLIKGLVHMAGAKTAGLLLGADFPVVLTSRSDSAQSKALSISLAVLNAGAGG